MLEALLISNVLLWLLVMGLALTVFALARQVGVLHERVAPAGALMGQEGPQVGTIAPRFDLVDWNGQPLTLGDAAAEAKSTLLVFVSPTCPVCKTMLAILESILQREQSWLRLVLASDGARAEHEEMVRAFALSSRLYVLSTELGITYRVSKLPYAVLIDPSGVIRAKGLVNTREHVESLFEAMERGVASVQEYLRNTDPERRVA